MIIGKVIGNVWATRKNDSLAGFKLMIVEPYDFENHEKQYPIVSADTIGAGIGDMVLMLSGSSARQALRDINLPIDSTIVGIIDQLDIPQEI